MDIILKTNPVRKHSPHGYTATCIAAGVSLNNHFDQNCERIIAGFKKPYIQLIAKELFEKLTQYRMARAEQDYANPLPVCKTLEELTRAAPENSPALQSAIQLSETILEINSRLISLKLKKGFVAPGLIPIPKPFPENFFNLKNGTLLYMTHSLEKLKNMPPPGTHFEIQWNGSSVCCQSLRWSLPYIEELIRKKILIFMPELQKTDL